MNTNEKDMLPGKLNKPQKVDTPPQSVTLNHMNETIKMSNNDLAETLGPTT